MQWDVYCFHILKQEVFIVYGSNIHGVLSLGGKELFCNNYFELELYVLSSTKNAGPVLYHGSWPITMMKVEMLSQVGSTR